MSGAARFVFCICAITFSAPAAAPGGAAAQETRANLALSVLDGAGVGFAWLAVPFETATTNFAGHYRYHVRAGPTAARLGLWVAAGIAAELVARERVDHERHLRMRRYGWIGSATGFAVGNVIGRVADRDRQLVGAYLGVAAGAFTGVMIALLEGETVGGADQPNGHRSVPIAFRIGF